MSEREQHGAEHDDDSGFDERGPVLQVGAFARAPHVDGGDHGDHGYGDAGGFEGRQRDDFGEIAREGAGERGDGAAGDHQKQTPAIEEGGDAAKAVADEDVQAAGFRVGGGEFRIRQSAEEREEAADDPDKEGVTGGAVELAKDQAGSEEDARADDGADEEEEKVAFAEGAGERGAGVGGRGFGACRESGGHFGSTRVP